MSKVDEEIKRRSQQSQEFAQAYQSEDTRLNIAVMMMKLRINLGYTQEEFAKKVDIPQSTVSRIESGKMNPTIEFINQIVGKLGKRLKLEITEL